MSKFIKDTIFFFKKSKEYMAGMKTTPIQWVIAYIRFMKLSIKDGNSNGR